MSPLQAQSSNWLGSYPEVTNEALSGDYVNAAPDVPVRWDLVRQDLSLLLGRYDAMAVGSLICRKRECRVVYSLNKHRAVKG